MNELTLANRRGENGRCITEQVRCAIISTETRVLSGAF